ncbi:hypothetical protein FZU57_01825 [Campylobacter jejuni]|uniref:Uncharacterized protein n=1 Tax=Campylobacter jejuni TaxID=197 RepID=A0A5Y9IT29_CAMJU|nr:hypothetical protein [Campylobacter jejuni]EAJ5894711.1 hypothetical protein [Campylobacter jejuni]EAJ8127297.1 hypothetical protein [Campylobacter jejuni]EAK8251515.1 hypothetical protein [Campylobacter jejuni]ECK7424282.1 hypothetical protein [Campylobacter jejuni]ECK7552586.1 hypothetical protein [Campylobacter jejuni]
MKKPFYKLKRFYIPCGVLVVLIIFISLAYRPLELIFWDRYDISKLSINNEEKNFKTMKTVNYSYFR